MRALLDSLVGRYRVWRLCLQAQRLARRSLDRKVHCDDPTISDRDGVLRLRPRAGR